jgi:hypothetical protein
MRELFPTLGKPTTPIVTNSGLALVKSDYYKFDLPFFQTQNSLLLTFSSVANLLRVSTRVILLHIL